MFVVAGAVVGVPVCEAVPDGEEVVDEAPLEEILTKKLCVRLRDHLLLRPSQSYFITMIMGQIQLSD